MILSIPLQAGTALANVRYYWIVGSVAQAPQSSGISQPDPTFPNFLFTVTPPDNAEEIVAYDTTNPSNWNVGEYELIVGTFPPGPPGAVIKVPSFAPPGLRTVTFKSQYEQVLRQHGFDPTGDAVTHDTLDAVVQQINTSILYAWRYWEWPQLELLQERAFRTRWSDTLQFSQVGSEGVPDELYYPVDTNYYRVLASAPGDPPAGTPPTNNTYFEPFDLTDRYILLDQVNETPIGEVIEIFAADPRLTTAHDAGRVRFRPTEREITVIDNTNATVFVQLRITPSEFTGTPYVAGRTPAYAVGDSVYNPTDGECYRALIDSPTGDPTVQPTQWLKIPFPQFLSGYVVMAAFAAGLGETGIIAKDTYGVEATHRRALMANAQQQADQALEQEVDRLRAQGQHYHYKRWRVPHNPYWWTYPLVSPSAT